MTHLILILHILLNLDSFSGDIERCLLSDITVNEDVLMNLNRGKGEEKNATVEKKLVQTFEVN